MFIGDNLKNLRILYGYSEFDLADKLGISNWYIVKQYETGDVQPDFQRVIELAKLFHVKSTYFYQPDLPSGNPNNIDGKYASVKYY